MRVLAVAILVLSAACGGGSPGADQPGEQASDGGGVLRIYTTVTQDTVDAVVSGFQAANEGATVEIFRAPTGEVAARIASELRDGELGADVLWMTDPLSIQQYARDGLLRTWEPEGVDVVPGQYRTDSFFGTRVLNLVIVAGAEAPEALSDWADLVSVDGPVAFPDPGFAGSAFAALAFFALSPDFGMDFYAELQENGAVQVRSPGDVVTGVAEGIYTAGITLDRTARDAEAAGSPVRLVWPESGAIALYSPIAVVATSVSPLAEAFVEHALTVEAQTAIASTGWQPIHADVDWEHGGPAQALDWDEAFDRQDEFLSAYRAMFGE